MAITSGNIQDYNFFNPGVDPQHPDYVGSDLWRSQAQNNQQGYYGYWIGQAGMLGMDPQSKAAQNLFNNYQAGYQAEQFGNPELSWVDFLKNKGYTGIQNAVAGMSPQERGIDRRQFAGGTQWLQRGS
jgi:hypothetical protein